MFQWCYLRGYLWASQLLNQQIYHAQIYCYCHKLVAKQSARSKARSRDVCEAYEFQTESLWLSPTRQSGSNCIRILGLSNWKAWHGFIRESLGRVHNLASCPTSLLCRRTLAAPLSHMPVLRRITEKWAGDSDDLRGYLRSLGRIWEILELDQNSEKCSQIFCAQFLIVCIEMSQFRFCDKDDISAWYQISCWWQEALPRILLWLSR